MLDTPSDARIREIRAAGPCPGAEGMRASYLELLKLCLCDLAGARTREVTSDRHKRVFSRELTDEQIRWRAEGRDWPLDGFTMVGLERLDDLQACVEAVVTDQIEGDLIEAGAWRGGASILIRATLDSLGARDRTLWVADSFEGFPTPGDQDARADRELESQMREVSFPTASLEAVQGYFARFGCDQGVRFLAGFFEDTLTGLRGRRWSLVRLDADTYKATKAALEVLYPGLAVGGYLVLDDYFHPFLPDSCRRAVQDYRNEHGIKEPIEQIDWTGARWRRQDAQPDEVRQAHDESHAPQNDPPPPIATRPPPMATRPPAPRIPTDQEMQLSDELAALQSRLERAEAELSALRASRMSGLAGWARRKLTSDADRRSG